MLNNFYEVAGQTRGVFRSSEIAPSPKSGHCPPKADLSAFGRSAVGRPEA
ncbi:MAG: hypothetical protein Q8R30_04030 [bacterium]|nr:hypothetical protein [bacterium]